MNGRQWGCDAPGLDDAGADAAAHAAAMHQLERAQERAIIKAILAHAITDDDARMLSYGCGLDWERIRNQLTFMKG